MRALAIGVIVVVTGCRLRFETRDTGTDADRGADAARDAPAADTGDGGIPFAANLIGGWRLNEGSGGSAAGSVGTATRQRSRGSSTVPTWTAGHEGTAVTFVGDGDRVAMGAPAALANLG